MKKTCYLLILSATIFSSLSAQSRTDSTVTRNVTVEREYMPVIQYTGKVETLPQIVEPGAIKAVPAYRDFNLPLAISTNIYTLPPARLQNRLLTDAKNGFAQIGLGSYPNTLVDFAYPLVKTEDTQLDVSLHHRGSFGNKLHSKTLLNIQFDKKFDAFNLFMGVNGGHEYFRYYGTQYNDSNQVVDLEELFNANPSIVYTETSGLNPQDVPLEILAKMPDTQTLLRTGAYVGLGSVSNTDYWQYRALMKYDLLHAIDKVTEHTVHTSGAVSRAFDDDRFGIDLDLHNIIYSDSKTDTTSFWDGYNVFSINPYYKLERSDNWSLRLGVKSAFSFGKGQAASPSPDIRFDWKIAPSWIALYGGFTGDYQINNSNRMLAENPYLSLKTNIADTYTPFYFYTGFKIKPFSNLLIDPFVSFKYIDNQYFFVNKSYENPTNVTVENRKLYTNRFDVVYSPATHLRVGMRANYNYKNIVNIDLSGAYNAWDAYDEERAWNKPEIEFDLNTNVKITKALAVSLLLFVEDGAYARLGTNEIKMPTKLDLNIGASYTYYDWLTFFANVNNLTNSKYYHFYGYEVQGINFMAGAKFSF